MSAIQALSVNHFHRIELTVTESRILEIGHRASVRGCVSRGRSSTYSEIHCVVWNGLARCIELLEWEEIMHDLKPGKALQ